jgi:nitroreductase
MLANLLALASVDTLRPRLYVGFVDQELNEVLGVDGAFEYALAVVGLGEGAASSDASLDHYAAAQGPTDRRFPLAEAAHAAGSLADSDSVRAWRGASAGQEPEPKLERAELARAIRRRRSIRVYDGGPLPRDGLAEALAWADAPIPADVPRVVRQVAAVAAVEGMAPGTYDARLEPLRLWDERELRRRAGLAAMDQDHSRDAAVNVFQLADLDGVAARHGDRGYRWAQLEAGIRAGRLQLGASMRGWGAVASTFFDDEVSRLLETHEAPMLMVALGRRPG